MTLKQRMFPSRTSFYLSICGSFFFRRQLVEKKLWKYLRHCGKIVKYWGLSQGEHLVEYAHYGTRAR